MKKVVLLLSALLLAATMAAAQAATQSHFAAPAANQTSANHSAATGSDLRGCLTGTKGDYMLVDHQGKEHKVVGNDHDLWNDTGHEVDITGQPGSAKAPFHESEITDIASRCWNFTLNTSTRGRFVAALFAAANLAGPALCP